MNLRPGAVIADVGSGGGYYTQQFAKAVAPNGMVVAVDTNQPNLDFVTANMAAAKLTNFKTHITPIDHLELPQRKFDWIFMRDIYHHIHDPEFYFQSIATFLKPKGLVLLIDYTKPKGFLMSFASPSHHYSQPEAIRGVMQHVGLDLFRSFNFLPDQSFQIFNLKH
jgi:ubiquinone/menaquinone biosynthesis C-methylase UbiE